MKAKRIEIVKDWPEPKSVHNIQVFLGFANFYWQFIQGFSRIATPLTLMLKMTRSADKPAFSKNDGSRSASSWNNDSKPASGKNDGNDEFSRFGSNGIKHAKKSGKSKSEKLAKSQKLSKYKSEKSKKSSKSGNLPNFNTIETGPSFLIPDARAVFNCLRLAFTETPILQYFNLKYHIWIKTNALGYAIGGVLN